MKSHLLIEHSSWNLDEDFNLNLSPTYNYFNKLTVINVWLVGDMRFEFFKKKYVIISKDR